LQQNQARSHLNLRFVCFLNGIYEVDSESSETLASERNTSSRSCSYESRDAVNCPI